MYAKYGVMGDFKMNNEAIEILMRIADFADHNRDFRFTDIDLTPFGIKVSEYDPDFDVHSIIKQKIDELQSLVSISSSSGYSSARSCDSQLSAISMYKDKEMRYIFLLLTT